MSVSVRGANTLKLTFLSAKDVTEFGAIEEATPLLVPPGAKIIDTSARTGESGKGYYQWDFEYGAAVATAAVSRVTATCWAPCASERWASSEAGFKRASASFGVGADAVANAKEREPQAREGTAGRGGEAGRRVWGRETKPPGTLDYKGPLPILCSVED